MTAWTDNGFYHACSSAHPATCAGCTADTAKHGKPTPAKIQEALAELKRIAEFYQNIRIAEHAEVLRLAAGV